LKGWYEFASGGGTSTPCVASELTRSLEPVEDDEAGEDEYNITLRPGNAPNTERLFSALAARWALRNAKRWARKVESESGEMGSAEERAHWMGERSRMSERCEARSAGAEGPEA
jgi:hypothetical protein